MMSTFKNARRALMLSIMAASALSVTATAQGPAEDYFSFAEGAWLVEVPEDSNMSQMASSPLNIIDGSANTDWEGPNGEAVFVLELAELTELHRIGFDTDGLNFDDKSAKGFVVEVSETGPDSGFTEVLSGTLKMAKNGQNFAFEPEDRPTARWVRLTILGNYGNDYTAFTGFHGYGKQLTQEATMPDLSGKYAGASGWGLVNVHDGDDGVSGCYSYQQGEFSGQVDGRVLKVNMHQRENGDRLEGLFQLAPDGRTLVGIVRNEGVANRDFYASYYSAEKESNRPNGC